MPRLQQCSPVLHPPPRPPDARQCFERMPHFFAGAAAARRPVRRSPGCLRSSLPSRRPALPDPGFLRGSALPQRARAGSARRKLALAQVATAGPTPWRALRTSHRLSTLSTDSAPPDPVTTDPGTFRTGRRRRGGAQRVRGRRLLRSPRGTRRRPPPVRCAPAWSMAGEVRLCVRSVLHLSGAVPPLPRAEAQVWESTAGAHARPEVPLSRNPRRQAGCAEAIPLPLCCPQAPAHWPQPQRPRVALGPLLQQPYEPHVAPPPEERVRPHRLRRGLSVRESCCALRVCYQRAC